MRGELVNLDQRLVSISAMDKSIYTIQWVEMGLERELQDGGGLEDTFELEKDVYEEGAKRWFTLFYNSSTTTFIDYFEKLIVNERRKSLVFP